MESLITNICANAQHAHWIIFLLIMLAGLSIPISEDILLLTGGAIAATCESVHPLTLYLWIFFACWISAWEAYWMGRLLGPKLFEFRWFRRMLSPHRLDRLKHNLERFGIFTFIVGRFIPGGVRNALFMSSGLIKMPFSLFIIRDGVGCLLATAVIFYIGYVFGENYQTVLSYFHTYQEVFIGLILAIILIVLYRMRRRSMAE